MKAQQIADRLENLLGQEINDWDREELAEKLGRMETRPRQVIMAHIAVIWPVSYALFLAFADRAEQALTCLGEEQFPAWVCSVLDVYEAEGLQRAIVFMDNVEDNFLCRVRGEAGLLFSEVEQTLLPYVRCASGQKVNLAAAEVPFTAVTAIYLPGRLAVFRKAEDNFLLYKLTATFMIGLDLLGTFRLLGIPEHFRNKISPAALEKKGGNPLDLFFQSFAEPVLAKDIFYLVEALRVISWMKEEYPGLLRDAKDIFQRIFISRRGALDGPPKSIAVEFLRLMVLQPEDDDRGKLSHLLPASFPPGFLNKPDCLSVEESMLKTEEIYDLCQGLEGEYVSDAPLPFMGDLNCSSAYEGLERRRLEIKEEFVAALAEVLLKREEGKGAEEKDLEERGKEKVKGSSEEGIQLVIEPAAEREKKDELRDEKGPSCILTIGGEEIDLPEDISRLALDIQRDLGGVPDEYISSASGRSGGALLPPVESSGALYGEETQGRYVYDEWDFRRSGFRKGWCHLIEKEITPIKGTFFEATLEKYRGQILNLRKQFEAMVLQESFVRRQCDGNDIDLDAVIEALSDRRAGLAPSERLFVRLQRNERNIAALFLVDMSNSTEGWVGKALKEALIMMCESLAVLGDRYAIYGFSGMRRTRSEFFTIKKFSDAYDDDVKGKISAVSPKEYTRMGPAIRHAAGILDGVDAKIRLLVTLSDGKPEDYDDYKGVYAIEDTRHALIEAKGRGVHPFCITVDKHSQDYISHMYGEVNYTFIDDVFKLPARIPHIYRNLTT